VALELNNPTQGKGISKLWLFEQERMEAQIPMKGRRHWRGKS
jgi:hypothetical protein